MREILFRGKCVDGKGWIEGYYYQKPNPCSEDGQPVYHGISDLPPFGAEIIPETVGQYTGMHEFVVTDKTICEPLFENDIVEVMTHRRPCTEYNPTSQYDGKCKVRATIVFKNGGWQLDYDNAYNHKLEKLRGKEESERTVKGARDLFHFGFHGNNEDWYREHNKHYVFGDIVRIGNIHDNPDLIGGTEE